MTFYKPRSIADGKALPKGMMLETKLVSRDRDGWLSQSLSVLNGVGTAVSHRAAELGIHTVGDLLNYPPFRYEDFSNVRQLEHVAIGEEATVKVEVKSCRVRPTRRRSLKILECEVSDETGTVKAVWYNQAYLAEQLIPGANILIRGKLEKARGNLIFKVRAHEFPSSKEGAEINGIHTLGLVPVYPSTEGLTTRKLRQMIWQIRDRVANVADPIPARLLYKLKLPRRGDALKGLHFPTSSEDTMTARYRLVVEELLIQQLAVATRRMARQNRSKACALGSPGTTVERWLSSLPFELTGDQKRAIGDLEGSLDSDRAMQKILMGEVGSGKTVVALYAMLRAVESEGQAALMAPTETLAGQHFQTVERLTGGLLRIGLLTGSTPDKKRREIHAGLRDGSIKLIVGTHSLIESDVAYKDLRLAVVDEQHRFGVEQRAALDVKGREGLVPHLLHMTATPIPRTLALTVYGDLDSITLRELPKGRSTVKTWLVPESKRTGAYEFIRKQLRHGRQCYIVCPLIEESEQVVATAVDAEYKRLAQGELSDFQVEAMHGQMSSKKKEATMARFVSGDTDVLVATSVVEVGIDIPNAAVIVIEEADRYGLSQLHQLRGRIGRGRHESFCLLFADPQSELARKRMDAVVSSQDGFELAETDLRLRGEGEILGTRQSGMPELRFARLPRDQQILAKARNVAEIILDQDEDLSLSEHYMLRELVRQQLQEQETVALAA